MGLGGLPDGHVNVLHVVALALIVLIVIGSCSKSRATVSGRTEVRHQQ